jgi:hypothetical protein
VSVRKSVVRASARSSSARITVRRRSDGTTSVTSRGASATDLRRVVPVLVRVVSGGPGTEAGPVTRKK